MILGLAGFALMAAFWPYIAGAATAPRWAVLTIMLLWLFTGPVRVTMAHVVGTLLIGWALVSLSWSAAWHDGVDAAMKLLVLAGIFAVGSTLRDLRPFYIGCAVGLGLSSAVSIVELTGFQPVPSQGGFLGAGLFVNSLFLAEAAALVLVALAAHGMWRWTALPLPALALSGGRGACVAVGVAFLVALWRRRPLWGIVGIWAGLLALTGAIMLRPATVQDRFGIWDDTVEGLTWLGRGFGSFFGTFPEFSAHMLPSLVRNDHAHSVPLETVYELGVVGAVLAIVLIGLLLRSRLWPERLVLVAFLVEGIFAFNDRLPATAGLAALVAGHLAGALPGWRRSLADGRSALCAWYGLGVAAAVYRRPGDGG